MYVNNQRLKPVGLFGKVPMNISDLVVSIIDVFEDFLQERNVVIPNDERTEAACKTNHPEDLALIYGSDYGDLQDAISSLLENQN